MPFPSTLSVFNRPSATDRLNSPSHSALHNTVSSALGQVEAVIGLDGNSSTLGTLIGDLRSPGSSGGGHIQSANKGGTGQTSYTKGDLLVAQSASVLSKLAVGSNNQGLIVDSTAPMGVKWGAIGINSATSVIGASTVWTKPTGATVVMIEMWGGGGSGASRSGNGGATGGGGGAYVNFVYPASDIPSSVLLTAGASVIGVDGSTNGNDGNDTTFGTLFTAAAGKGGQTQGGVSGVGADGGQILVNSLSRGIYGHGGSVYGTIDSEAALYSAGSGGYNNSPEAGNGGRTIWGGAGGATIASVNGQRVVATAGSSYRGGNGGQASIVSTSSVVGVAGSVPGGGGSAGGNATSGSGAPGKIIVYTT